MDTGLLIVRGSHAQVRRWVRRGTLPVVVVPRAPWTVLVPGGRGRAMAPYSDGPEMLAAHPLGRRLRPSVGLFVEGPRAVITCWPSRWRGVPRWVQWTPGEGAGPIEGFALARPADLARATGHGRHRGAPGAIHDVLADGGGTAEQLLTDLTVLLGLPLAEVLTGTAAESLPGAELITPAEASVEGFDKLVVEEQQMDLEVEEGL